MPRPDARRGESRGVRHSAEGHQHRQDGTDSGRLALDDPTQPVELLELPPSPHVNAALALWLPRAGYLYQSDLHVPRSQASKPAAARAGTECWFARWAVKNLPDNAVVLSSHTLVRTPIGRLREYLASEPCKA